MQSDLELVKLSKRYGTVTAVDAIDLRIPAASYCCLLGPFGCGKISTLRMIAGHEIASDGDIILRGRNITVLPAAERGTAMMFQSYVNRQGYYSAVLETAKSKMEPYEWAYWREGKAASRDIKSPNGDVLAKAGEKRDGGSYEQRMGGIVCWNAVMDENAYMVQKWNEFVAA